MSTKRMTSIVNETATQESTYNSATSCKSSIRLAYQKLTTRTTIAAASMASKNQDKLVNKPAGEWQSFDIAFRAARFDGGKKIEDAPNYRVSKR